MIRERREVHVTIAAMQLPTSVNTEVATRSGRRVRVALPPGARPLIGRRDERGYAYGLVLAGAFRDTFEALGWLLQRAASIEVDTEEVLGVGD
jgi:hypothetical protein